MVQIYFILETYQYFWQ